jgi:threonine/homoserine/homoserine lactone efflux protein
MIIGILIGFGLNLIEQHIRSGRSSPIGYIAFAAILPVLIDQEAPIGLKLADLLQPLVVLFLMWRIAVIVSDHSSRPSRASPTRFAKLEQRALPRVRHMT